MRRRARGALRRAPTASPPHPRTAAARSAGPPSIWQLCAYGPNRYFSKWYYHPDSAPQAAAIEPGYFGTVAAPPRSLCAQVHPAAAARGENAPKKNLLCSSNLFCRWIIFSGLQFHPSSNHVEWQQGKCEQKRGREDYSWHVACFFNFEANRGRDAQEACSESFMFSYSLSSPQPRPLQAFDPVPNYRNAINRFQNAPVFGRWERASGRPIYVHGPVDGVNFSHLRRCALLFCDIVCLVMVCCFYSCAITIFSHSNVQVEQHYKTSAVSRQQ